MKRQIETKLGIKVLNISEIIEDGGKTYTVLLANMCMFQIHCGGTKDWAFLHLLEDIKHSLATY